MAKKSTKNKKRRRIEPYWYLIVVFALIMGIIFVNHLMTGRTPNRVALHLDIFNLDVFWYGIFIVAGIALGAWVTASIAAGWAAAVFDENVPQKFQTKPLTVLDLTDEMVQSLKKRKVNNLGELLFEWGLNPDRLNVGKKKLQEIKDKLETLPGVLAIWLTDAPWRQWNPDHVWGGIIWVVVLGVIGARLYHVLTPSPSMEAEGIFSALDYFRNPMQLINIRSGGLGIYGAIIGGFLGIILYTRRQRISAIAWADLAVVGMSIGQFMGRWANFFNQELYGGITELPWGIYIANRVRGTVFANMELYPFETTRFHPAFLYESLWSLLTFFVLYYLARRKRDDLQRGDLLALYLVFYATGRILLELIRLDSRNFSIAGLELGIPVATLVSIIIAIPMAALLIYRHIIAKD